MKQKICLALTLTLSLLVVTAYADGDRHQQRLQRLATELQLSDAQLEQFSTIMENHHESRKANRESNREERKAMHESLLSELGDVLTEQQLNTFRELSQKHRKRKMDKHSHNARCEPSASLSKTG